MAICWDMISITGNRSVTGSSPYSYGIVENVTAASTFSVSRSGPRTVSSSYLRPKLTMSLTLGLPLSRPAFPGAGELLPVNVSGSCLSINSRGNDPRGDSHRRKASTSTYLNIPSLLDLILPPLTPSNMKTNVKCFNT